MESKSSSNARRRATIISDESGANRTVYKKTQIPNGEPYVFIPLSMFESPAWTTLSLAARRVYERLMIEHMRHGGTKNGQLPCTYSDFEKFGVRRKSIAVALDQLVALGFIKCIRKGHLMPDSDNGTPSLYLITSLSERYGKGYLIPTYDWRKFETVTEAKAASKRFTSLARPKRQARAKRLSQSKISNVSSTEQTEQNHLGATAPLN